MARQSDELAAAWRALSGTSVADGWRTIPITPAGACRLLAAREFPGDLEAVLVGFGPAAGLELHRLPESQGFSVRRCDPVMWGDAGTWLALSRKRDGRLDLFLSMIDDVLHALESESDASPARAAQVFLDRICAWQAFMRRGMTMLSPEAELGLMGELFLLRDLLDAGLAAQITVDAWQGPLDGLHDFVLGAGAIEVKSTLALHGFTATILSLEQLDDVKHSPLLFAGLRLHVGDAGLLLPELVRDIKSMLALETAATSMFHERLLAVGYTEAFEHLYTRRFTRLEAVLCPVSGAFPRLTQSMVPVGVISARYDISLSHLSLQTAVLSSFLQQAGVTLI